MISSIASVTSAPAPAGSADTVPAKKQTGSTAAAPESTVVNLSQPGSSYKTVLDYLPADANQDGQVGELERRAYDLEHPTLAARERADDAASRASSKAVQAYQTVSGND